MSIFAKLFILLILFIVLNIISIYTFSYEKYFSDTKKEFPLDDNKGLFDFFNKVEYSNSDFTITKIDGLLVLSGTFSNQKIVNQVVDILKINRVSDIKFVQNSKLDKKILENIYELIDYLKDFFDDGAKIIFENNTLKIYGTLKDIAYKELILTKISNITSIHTIVDIYEPIVVEDEVIDNVNLDNKIDILTKDEIQLLINNTIIENKIIFERRSVELTPNSKDSVKKIADILNIYNSYKVEIGGHTDSRGNKELNKQISQDRANSVKSLLESFGVESSRITAVGYGNEKPIAKDDKDGLSEINRRVEFIIGE
ncbi:OmpA family protein [Arcobacter lanthieri]|uniref:OmpA family protein n=1 Tax=Aliarcobacter lanthieri TaxID=1355374 RepID=UPI0019217A59|nr:OmpA family protein [Aliarcobacter lanthieri]MBL3519568.1 OmpA family protein [Aliarcobacter lanthieri]